MASEDAVVEDLILRLDLAEGSEAQNAVRNELIDGGEELALRIAEALPSLRGHEAVIACGALATIGPDARDALPALREVARRRWLLVLRAGEARAAERAIVALRADEPDFVLAALESNRPETREGAVQAIACGHVPLTDDQAQDAAWTLTEMLDADSWSRSAGAIAALSALGPNAALAVARLSELALAEDAPDDPAGIRRLVYVQGLGGLGRAGVEVGSVLAQLLTDSQEHVRWATIAHLRRVGPQSPKAVPALLRALTFESPPIGMVAPGFEDLPEEQQQSTRDAMEEARREHQAEVRAVAAWALGELGASDERVVSALAQSTRSTSARLRYHAATALGRIGHSRDDVASALTRAVGDDPAGHVRRASARALGLMGDPGHGALTALTDALTDVHTRKSAAWALKRLGEAALPAAPALIDAFDGNERRRMVIVDALVRSGPEVLQDLRQGMHRDGRWQRIGCADAAAAMGEEARGLEPTLRELLFDRRPDVQEAAREALEAISGDDAAEPGEGDSDE